MLVVTFPLSQLVLENCEVPLLEISKDFKKFLEELPLNYNLCVASCGSSECVESSPQHSCRIFWYFISSIDRHLGIGQRTSKNIRDIWRTVSNKGIFILENKAGKKHYNTEKKLKTSKVVSKLLLKSVSWNRLLSHGNIQFHW